MSRIFLSLAALVCLLIAQPQAAQQAASPRAAASTAVTGVVNINTASVTDLEALPGIGAKTATLIVEYRQKNGPFKKIEDLMNIRGIGEKNFLKLKPQIAVAAAKGDHQPN